MAITLDGTTGITTPGLTNTGTETLVNLTTTGNTTLGDASTDTLNVGNGGLVKDASGNVGIGTATPQAKLHVVGNIIANESQKIGFRYASGDAGPYVYMSAGSASTSLNFYANASGTATDKNYIFYGTASNTEIVNILGNGNISTIGLLDISASTAGQIKFPATQNASSNANTLDDYEEGSWTPVVTSASYTSSSTSGTYTKIGRLVYCRFNLVFSAVNASSNSICLFSGFPFTSTATSYAGVAREDSSTGAIFVVVIDSSNTTGAINSYSGLSNNSTLTLQTSKTYVCSVTYQTS